MVITQIGSRVQPHRPRGANTRKGAHASNDFAIGNWPGQLGMYLIVTAGTAGASLCPRELEDEIRFNFVMVLNATWRELGKGALAPFSGPCTFARRSAPTKNPRRRDSSNWSSGRRERVFSHFVDAAVGEAHPGPGSWGQLPEHVAE
jgi:hypothetical protein